MAARPGNGVASRCREGVAFSGIGCMDGKHSPFTASLGHRSHTRVLKSRLSHDCCNDCVAARGVSSLSLLYCTSQSAIREAVARGTQARERPSDNE